VYASGEYSTCSMNIPHFGLSCVRKWGIFYMLDEYSPLWSVMRKHQFSVLLLVANITFARFSLKSPLLKYVVGWLRRR
jgi:hypothetical protein